MTRSLCVAPHAPPEPEWLPGLQDATDALYGALVAATGHSDRASVDLDAIGRELGLRPLTWRVALCVLRERGLIVCRHEPDAFHLAEILLPPGEQY